MVEGILNNEESSNQSLLFIRDLICIDEQIRKEKDPFYNKKESDDTELKKLRDIIVKTLPKNNVFKLTVISI
jgi:hypothetical protein